MKHLLIQAAAAVVLLSLGRAAFATPATLSLEENGVKVSAGALGTFSISSPVLKNAQGQDVPLVSRTAKGAQSATWKFFDDTQIEVSVDDAAKTITFGYPTRSATSKIIALSAFVPFELRQGGAASFDGQSVPFPLDLKPGADGHSIWRGEAGRFEIKTALGQVLAIGAPRNWQQLQDNRFWNDNKSFQWVYQHDMGRDPRMPSFSLKIEDVAAGAPAPVLPSQIVDRWGQSKLVSFPEKIKSDGELKADAQTDKAYYAGFKAPTRDIYGGLPGSGARLGLKKTGFFHVEKIKDAKRGEMPVLVDPEGNLFFQLGLCSVGGGGDSYTYLPGRGDKFDEVPSKDGEFASSFIDGGTAYSFYATNWTRKHGKAWSREDFMAQTIERARALGFNSAGAFSGDTGAARAMSFPTVGFLPFDGLERIPDTRNILDPFAEGAAAKMDALFAAKVAPSNNDPLLIGHFLGNEEGFDSIPKVVPGLNSKSGAKKRLVAMLRAKYADIGAWNKAWQPKDAAKSFDELADARLFVVTQAAAQDMDAFYVELLEAYYKMIAQAYRKHAPNHLLLGNRWLSSTAADERTVRVAGKYLDVVSVNLYAYALEPAFLKGIHQQSGGRPILLSEWHYGATDQGLSGGARQVASQRERGLAYRNYVEQAAALGFVVGHEWFSYLDQPLTGRWFQRDNGEQGNIGLVNVADRPYREMLSQATRANFDVYDVLLGRKPPFAFDDPRFSGAGGGRKVALVPRALPGMTINGAQDNWPGLPGERITRLVGGTDIEGKSVSGDFRLAWDEANLYLYVAVKDPTPMQNEATGEGLWQADSIEMFIGASDLDKGGALQFSDRQVLLSARKGADGFRWYFANSPMQLPVKMEIVPSVGGYSLEAAIPFKALGFTPRENQELLFDIGLNDSTAGRRQLMWNGGARNSGDRSAWGRARLVK